MNCGQIRNLFYFLQNLINYVTMYIIYVNRRYDIMWSRCQCLATGRLFSPGTPVSSTNKTDRHDITELLLKVALISQPKHLPYAYRKKKQLKNMVLWVLKDQFQTLMLSEVLASCHKGYSSKGTTRKQKTYT